jgi:hypothetical protein
MSKNIAKKIMPNLNKEVFVGYMDKLTEFNTQPVQGLTP